MKVFLLNTLLILLLGCKSAQPSQEKISYQFTDIYLREYKLENESLIPVLDSVIRLSTFQTTPEEVLTLSTENSSLMDHTTSVYECNTYLNVIRSPRTSGIMHAEGAIGYCYINEVLYFLQLDSREKLFTPTGKQHVFKVYDSQDYYQKQNMPNGLFILDYIQFRKVDEKYIFITLMDF